MKAERLDFRNYLLENKSPERGRKPTWLAFTPNCHKLENKSPERGRKQTTFAPHASHCIDIRKQKPREGTKTFLCHFYTPDMFY